MTCYKFSSLIKFSDYAVEILKVEKKNRPSVESYLALEIFLLIASQTMKNDPLPLKSLFLNVQAGEFQIRKQLKRLMDMELCFLTTNESDMNCPSSNGLSQMG
jgi:hypothetical protein